MKLLFTMVLFAIAIAGIGQPYFDAITIRGGLSPNTNNRNMSSIPIKYGQFVSSVSLPVTFKTDSSKLILTAYYDRWKFQANTYENINGTVQSLLFGISYLKPLNGKWSAMASLLPRWNGNSNDLFYHSFQLGGSLLATYKKSDNLTVRLGVYYNSEFFGPFIIPLAGLDWKISKRDNLFGLLPQILNYEHKVSDRFSFGARYRMFNNSYRSEHLLRDQQLHFKRIIEMQCMLNADIYLARKIVFEVEAGHSIIRQVKLGEDNSKKNYYWNENIAGGFIFKAALLYRIRLR